MAIFKTCYLGLVLVFLSPIFLSSVVASIEKEHFRRILGVKQRATNVDIRSAYKRLVKEWHPDKTDHPHAMHKFLEIQRAYEQLMHDDGVGTLPFQEIKERSLRMYLSFYKEIEVTEEDFRMNLMLKSVKMPIVIVTYHDQCYRCALLVHMYRTLAAICKNASIHFVVLNSHAYTQLVESFGLRPDYSGVVLLMEMSFASYQDTPMTLQNILNFIGAVLKRHITIERVIDYTDLMGFLQGWRDENRVRALIAAPEKHKDIELIYLVAAFTWRSYISFCYIPVDHVRASVARARFQLVPEKHSLLVFHEDTEYPVARLITNDTSKKLLWPLLQAHQYPQLPRLRTQQMLDDLCPTVAVSSRPYLCVVLTWDSQERHELARNVLRDIVKATKPNSIHMRHVFLHSTIQRPFIESILKRYIEERLPNLMVIWRWNNTELAFEEIQNIDWTDQRALARKINRAATRLVKSCWNACSTRTVPRLCNEFHYLTFTSFLKERFDAFCRVMRNLVPILMVLIGITAFRVFSTCYNALKIAALIRQRDAQLLLAIYLRALLAFMQLEAALNRAQLELELSMWYQTELNFELMLVLVEKRRFQRYRNMNFMHKLALRFGTLRWIGIVRRFKKLRCVRHPRLGKQNRRPKKRIGSVFPRYKHAKLSIYCKRTLRRNRQARKIRNFYRYARWFLVIIPRSILVEEVPQMILN